MKCKSIKWTATLSPPIRDAFSSDRPHTRPPTLRLWTTDGLDLPISRQIRSAYFFLVFMISPRSLSSNDCTRHFWLGLSSRLRRGTDGCLQKNDRQNNAYPDEGVRVLRFLRQKDHILGSLATTCPSLRGASITPSPAGIWYLSLVLI